MSRSHSDSQPAARCDCGAWPAWWTGAGRARHAAQHRQWAAGVPLTPAVQRWLGCRTSSVTGPLAVTANAPVPARRLAYTLARLFQRENGYDFGFLRPPPLAWSATTVAYLTVQDGRALALAIVDTVGRWGYYAHRDARGQVSLDQAMPTRTVAGIWVAATHRREGLARQLVLGACVVEGLQVEEIAWGGPFTTDGRALALAMVPCDRLRVA